jgi:CDGSH-type Zn-finger protein
MTNEQDEPRIEVRENGPYRVSGGPPVGRTYQIETEYGEPIDWAPVEPLEPPGETYELCRCGGSSTKPFCDGKGCEAGFDGTEVADRGTYAERAHAYEGDGATMFDDRTLCTRAGYCGDRFTNVWSMIRHIDDPEIHERLRTMVKLCPSGRIVYVADGADQPDEIEYAPSIAVQNDGPVWVRGGIPVIAADGTPYEVRNRVTLCRCGNSRNKPFCDGSHQTTGFTDPEHDA